MKQVLLYSIQPQHMLNILNGRKTIEIRKRTLPQWALDVIARGEVVTGYGYCTKGKPYLYLMEEDNTYLTDYKDKGSWGNVLNGLVVVKFQVSGVEKLPFICGKDWVLGGYYDIQPHDIPLKACLNIQQLNLYGNSADLYAHHLTNITPIEPMELREFYKEVPFFETRDKEKYLFEFGKYAVRDKEKIDEERKLTKAPQSFMTAWLKGEMK